jgi:hypothetical protein
MDMESVETKYFEVTLRALMYEHIPVPILLLVSTVCIVMAKPKKLMWLHFKANQQCTLKDLFLISGWIWRVLKQSPLFKSQLESFS